MPQPGYGRARLLWSLGVLATLWLLPSRATAQDISVVNPRRHGRQDQRRRHGRHSQADGEHHGGRVHARQGLPALHLQAGQPEHQHVRPLPLARPDARRPDLHRPSRPYARRRGPQRHVLAAVDDLVHRILRHSRPALQPHGLVARGHATDADIRQPPVPGEPGPDARGRHGPESRGALDAGLLAVLGGQRPADDGGVHAGGLLVRRLRHRAAAARASGTPPASTPISASSV